MYNIPRKESNSSNCSNLFTTPIDLHYNNDHSEDEVMSFQETTYLNDMLKDYCGNDEYENLSYNNTYNITKKTSSKIAKTSCSTNDISTTENNKNDKESFECLHLSLSLANKAEEIVKISKSLKEDWKSRANAYKLNTLFNLKESIKLGLGYSNTSMVINNKGNFNQVTKSDAQSNGSMSINTLNNSNKGFNYTNSNSSNVNLNTNYNKINNDNGSTVVNKQHKITSRK